ncbi:hypothetical protein J2Z48_001879 [Croceifilum oryzae]|uniref:Uncharacterized protein n=1 Tax=Croceifilum oryzae TaxID=1553429 RepID=A0AAJ1TNH5_9BACL|nr:hypothetical protein [Croceifilum oryzae]MDQ0417706.1 hypothetical protein [Croceifilum oryzae]
MATFMECIRHKKQISPAILRSEGVHAIGVGYANPQKPSQGACIITYIDKSLSTRTQSSMASSIRTKLGIPARIPVLFERVGKFQHHAAKPLNQTRIRPVPGGVSISSDEPIAGTAGIIVTNFPKPNHLYVFSNKHVLVPERPNATNSTFQPGVYDRGRARINRIGKLFQYAQPVADINYIDAALAKPRRNKLLDPRYLLGNTGQKIIVPGHLISCCVGMKLIKTGRTTGFRRGNIRSVHTDVLVDGEDVFVDQIIVTRHKQVVGKAGDSGSVWLHDQDHFAAAVEYAGTTDGRISVCFPFHWVSQVFGIRVAVPTPHGGFRAGVTKGRSNRPDCTQPLTKAQLNQIQVINAS